MTVMSRDPRIVDAPRVAVTDHDIASRTDYVARRHVDHGRRHADGDTQLHCPTNEGATGRRRQPGQPDRGRSCAVPSLAAAKDAGYIPVTPPGRKIVHYINPSIYRHGPTIDPHNIPVLVYVNTADGAVLSRRCT